MALDIVNGDRSILDWDEEQVQGWLSKLGFPQYHQQIKGEPSLSIGWNHYRFNCSCRQNITSLVMCSACSIQNLSRLLG